MARGSTASSTGSRRRAGSILASWATPGHPDPPALPRPTPGPAASFLLTWPVGSARELTSREGQQRAAYVGMRSPFQVTLVMLCRVPETHFDEWVAQRYEALWPELF